MNKKPGIFDGLIVVELASVLAGPSVGMFFAELGAKVIKFENRNTAGDMIRKWKSPDEDPDSKYSAYYCSVNWGKETHFADMNDTADKELVLNWIKKADIVLSNYKASSAKNFGLDYETVSQFNPGIIYASLSGFYSDDTLPAYDGVLQAESGFMSMNGTPESGPLKMPVALIDIMAGHQLKEAVLIALFKRERSEKGAFIKVSLEKSAIASLANQATNWLMNGQVPERIGNHHPNIAPYGVVFKTKDNRWVISAIGTNRQFSSFCKLLGNLEWAESDHFSDNRSRLKNRNSLAEKIAGEIQNWDSKTLIDSCRERNIPFGLVRDVKEVFNSPTGTDMVISEKMPDGKESKRVSSIAFDIKW